MHLVQFNAIDLPAASNRFKGGMSIIKRVYFINRVFLPLLRILGGKLLKDFTVFDL